MDNKQNYGFLKFGIVLIAVILFFKTADVMTYFAPPVLHDLILNFTGYDMQTALVYGITTAFLVEGLAIYLDFAMSNNGYAQFVKWVLIGISALCQIYDGYIVQKITSQMTDSMKAVFSFGVPLIPIVIFALTLGIKKNVGNGTRSEFIGIIPMFNKLLHGSGQGKKDKQNQQQKGVGDPSHPIPAKEPFIQPKQ